MHWLQNVCMHKAWREQSTIFAILFEQEMNEHFEILSTITESRNGKFKENTSIESGEKILRKDDFKVAGMQRYFCAWISSNSFLQIKESEG